MPHRQEESIPSLHRRRPFKSADSKESSSTPRSFQAAGEMREMLRRPIGVNLLAGAFLVAGLAGIAAVWVAWPRTSNTSPLAAMFALMWSCTYVFTAILTWRRAGLAAPVFLAAIGLLVFPASFIVPGGQLLLPSLAVIVPVAFLGYRYLRRAGEA